MPIRVGISGIIVFGRIIPSLNGFVPKPNTPLQWDAICNEKELKKRVKYVCKGLSKIPNVDVRFM